MSILTQDLPERIYILDLFITISSSAYIKTIFISSVISSQTTCILIVLLHQLCLCSIHLFHHLFRSLSWRQPSSLSHPPALLWDPEAFTGLKRICSPLYMFRVWPQGIFLVWRGQEASWSDAQTTSAGSFHCTLAVMCHQTGVTWLSPNKSGQNRASCGVWRVGITKINSEWTRLAHPTREFLIPQPQRPQFLAHQYQSADSRVCWDDWTQKASFLTFVNFFHHSIFLGFHQTGTDDLLATAPSSRLSNGAFQHVPLWWPMRSHTSG